MKNLIVLTFSSKTWYEVTLFLLHNKNILLVGFYIWICVLDYLNKTQTSRSFGAKPPCQDDVNPLPAQPADGAVGRDTTDIW